jgi:hypothetical protein
LLGAPSCLKASQRTFLDLTGNGDGAFNLGDMLSYLDRKKVTLSGALPKGVSTPLHKP